MKLLVEEVQNIIVYIGGIESVSQPKVSWQCLYTHFDVIIDYLVLVSRGQRYCDTHKIAYNHRNLSGSKC